MKEETTGIIWLIPLVFLFSQTHLWPSPTITPTSHITSFHWKWLSTTAPARHLIHRVHGQVKSQSQSSGKRCLKNKCEEEETTSILQITSEAIVVKKKKPAELKL